MGGGILACSRPRLLQMRLAAQATQAAANACAHAAACLMSSCSWLSSVVRPCHNVWCSSVQRPRHWCHQHFSSCRHTCSQSRVIRHDALPGLAHSSGRRAYAARLAVSYFSQVGRQLVKQHAGRQAASHVLQGTQLQLACSFNTCHKMPQPGRPWGSLRLPAAAAGVSQTHTCSCDTRCTLKHLAHQRPELHHCQPTSCDNMGSAVGPIRPGCVHLCAVCHTYCYCRTTGSACAGLAVQPCRATMMRLYDSIVGHSSACGSDPHTIPDLKMHPTQPQPYHSPHCRSQQRKPTTHARQQR
jgi:hypothetical protein